MTARKIVKLYQDTSGWTDGETLRYICEFLDQFVEERVSLHDFLKDKVRRPEVGDVILGSGDAFLVISLDPPMACSETGASENHVEAVLTRTGARRALYTGSLKLRRVIPISDDAESLPREVAVWQE
jgi:hypothetical protein